MSQNTPSDNTHLLIKFSENLFSFSSLEQNQSPTKSKWKCLEAVEKCGAQSSAHGWSHGWGTSSAPKRLFWLTVTAISFGALCYFIKLRVNDYLNSDIATSFSFEDPESGEIPMPHLTICSVNEPFHGIIFHRRN